MMIQLCLCSFVFLSDLGSGLEVMSVSEYARLVVSQSRAVEKTCQCVKVTVGKSCWLWLFCWFLFLFFSPSCSCVSGSYRNSLSGEAFMPLVPLSHLQTQAWLQCVFTPGLCRWPFACKGSTGDLVVLRTKNLKYCRCGTSSLPGPLSHIPKFRTARQPACPSVHQGRRVLCSFSRGEVTVTPRNAHCPLWVRARPEGVTSRWNEVCNVNFSSIW